MIAEGKKYRSTKGMVVCGPRAALYVGEFEVKCSGSNILGIGFWEPWTHPPATSITCHENAQISSYYPSNVSDQRSGFFGGVIQ